MINPISPFKILHIVAKTGEDFLFTLVGGASASGDTPSSVPFFTLMTQQGNPVDWEAVDVNRQGSRPWMALEHACP